jgi:hypothetical protein
LGKVSATMRAVLCVSWGGIRIRTSTGESCNPHGVGHSVCFNETLA